MSNRSILIKVSEKLEEAFGLHIKEHRLGDIERLLKIAASKLNYPSYEDLTEVILSASQLDIEHKNALSSIFTIGETYFFREKPFIALVMGKIIPELLGSTPNRKIHIWSAGCSSGEEAYSIAMLIAKNFPSIKPEKCEILATDVNLSAIEKAEKGVYSEWSFREHLDEYTSRYFTKSGNSYKISEDIKQYIRFKTHNLATDPFPASSDSDRKWDLIVCRNVLMYLSPSVIKRCARSFHDSLKDNGWFITSQVELNEEYFSIFCREYFEDGIFYRKCNKNETQKTEKVQETPAKSKPEHKKRSKSIKVQTSEEHIVKEESIIDLKKMAEQLANNGEYKRSAELIEKIVARGGADSDIYYLYGTLLVEQDQLADAKEAFKRSLYINHNNFMAHYMSGNIYMKEGNKSLALNHFKNSLDIIGGISLDEVMSHTGGLSRDRFADILNKLIEELK